MGLKHTLKNFEDDIEKSITNPKEKEYFKERFKLLICDLIEEINDNKEKEIQELKKDVEKIANRMTKIQEVVDNIESDIYADDGFDFEIVCPYCDNEFIIDVNENKTEVECPECNNIIELDWSGDIEDDSKICGGYSQNCHGCNGCGIDENDDDNDQEEYEEDDM